MLKELFSAIAKKCPIGKGGAEMQKTARCDPYDLHLISPAVLLSLRSGIYRNHGGKGPKL
jgi:hypothetical protein